MITTGDIGGIIYKDCDSFGLERFRYGNIPKGEIDSERVIIYVKDLVTDDIWNSVFVNVNLCVPDKNGVADLERLKELEREAVGKLDHITGMYDGTRYAYGVSSIGTEKDDEMKCHYVNVRLKFDVLNVL